VPLNSNDEARNICQALAGAGSNSGDNNTNNTTYNTTNDAGAEAGGGGAGVMPPPSHSKWEYGSEDDVRDSAEQLQMIKAKTMYKMVGGLNGVRD